MSGTPLPGATVLITGGAHGIGRATAELAVTRGARVALLDIDEAALAAAASALGGAVSTHVADVSDPAALHRAVDAAAAHWGGLDVVIANAGVAPPLATVAGTPAETYERVRAINLDGVWHTASAALRHLGTGGHLVLVSSVYAFLLGVLEAPYGMTKAGVESLGRTLRVELAEQRIGVTVAHFGFVDTALVNGTIDGDPLAARLESRLPAAIRRPLPPADAATRLLNAVERGRPRVVAPSPWRLAYVLRGVLGPLGDAAMARDRRLQAVLRDARAREATRNATARR